jgi:hypothetical protein
MRRSTPVLKCSESNGGLYAETESRLCVGLGVDVRDSGLGAADVGSASQRGRLLDRWPFDIGPWHIQ